MYGWLIVIVWFGFALLDVMCLVWRTRFVLVVWVCCFGLWLDGYYWFLAWVFAFVGLIWVGVCMWCFGGVVASVFTTLLGCVGAYLFVV